MKELEVNISKDNLKDRIGKDACKWDISCSGWVADAVSTHYGLEQNSMALPYRKHATKDMLRIRLNEKAFRALKKIKEKSNKSYQKLIIEAIYASL